MVAVPAPPPPPMSVGAVVEKELAVACSRAKIRSGEIDSVPLPGFQTGAISSGVPEVRVTLIVEIPEARVSAPRVWVETIVPKLAALVKLEGAAIHGDRRAGARV